MRKGTNIYYIHTIDCAAADSLNGRQPDVLISFIRDKKRVRKHMRTEKRNDGPRTGRRAFRQIGFTLATAMLNK